MATFDTTMLAATVAAAATLLAAFLTLLGVMLRMLLSQLSRRIDARLAGIENAQQAERSGVEELQKKVEAISSRLPLEYVRREDWIRFSSSIDAKLDHLADLFNRSQGKV